MALIDDNIEVKRTYEAIDNAHYPTDNFLRNAQTLKIVQTDWLEEGEGSYYPPSNTLYYGTYIPDVILHELIHVASYDGTNEVLYKRGKKYIKSCGFTMEDSNIEKVGLGISEGLTEYFRMKFYNNAILDRAKISCDNYYYEALLNRLLFGLTSEKSIGDLFFDNALTGFVQLLEEKIGDHNGIIIGLSDEILELDTKSLISNLLFKSNKVNLTNNLIDLSYANIKDRDLEPIFRNHISFYFNEDCKGYQVATKKLEKTIKKYR